MRSKKAAHEHEACYFSGDIHWKVAFRYYVSSSPFQVTISLNLLHHDLYNFIVYILKFKRASQSIGGRKGGAMGLQLHLILRVLHRILIFHHRDIFFSVN